MHSLHRLKYLKQMPSQSAEPQPQQAPEMMLQKLTGRITNLKTTADYADFVYTDSDKKLASVLAVGAAVTGLPGQASALATQDTEEKAYYLEFELDGQRVKGWVWYSPFEEGDEVEVAVQWQGDHYELYGMMRPKDRVIALYPHCSRGQSAHWRAVWKAWLIWPGVSVVFCTILLVMICLFDGDSLEFMVEIVSFSLSVGAGGVYAIAFFIAWNLGSRWDARFGQLTEKVFAALEIPNPSRVDLPKRTRQYRKAHSDEKHSPYLGAMYFKY